MRNTGISFGGNVGKGHEFLTAKLNTDIKEEKAQPAKWRGTGRCF
jgi:hypothetical protein